MNVSRESPIATDIFSPFSKSLVITKGVALLEKRLSCLYPVIWRIKTLMEVCKMSDICNGRLFLRGSLVFNGIQCIFFWSSGFIVATNWGTAAALPCTHKLNSDNR
jgi:hypothetical protein